MSGEWRVVESVPTRKRARGPIDEAVKLDTREGTVVAQPGDYVIEESDGNRYPIGPQKFERFYRVVEE